MSYIATVMMLGSMALTPLGGVVAEAFGWREVFLVKLPLLALVLWMGYRMLPAGRAGGNLARRLPLPDSSLLRDVLLVGGAITAGLLAIEQIEGRWMVAVGLALGAVAMATWWARLPTSQPVLALVRRRALGFPALSLLLMSSIIGLVVFSLPYFIADVMRRSPEILGFAILCFVGSASVVSPIAGMLADRFAPRPVATIGGTLAAVGVLSMVTLGAAAGLMDLAWRMAVIGAGMALFNAPNMSAILEATPAGQAGTAGGISTIARTLGNSIGPAVAALAWSLGGGGTKGFRAGVVALTGFAAAGVIAQMAGPRTQRHKSP
jgi:MFS family permease